MVKHFKTMSVLFCIALLVAGAFLWKHRAVELSTEAAVSKGLVDSETIEEETPEQSAKRTSIARPKTTYQEPKKTDTRRGEESKPDRTGNEMIDAVQTALSSQEPKVAFDAYLALQRCRDVPLSPEALQNRFAAVDRAQEDPSFNLDSMIAIRDNLAAQQQVQSECVGLLSEKSGELGRKLEDQARAGNQMARFLYAMWAPNDELSLLLGSELLIEFETNALAFTLSNLDEGSALGLLALGLSYSTGDYFTPQHVSLGSALLIASNLCSGGVFLIEPQLGMNSTVLNAKSSFSAVASEELLLEQSTKFYEAHCAQSLSRSVR
jgi:hypothetical protein